MTDVKFSNARLSKTQYNDITVSQYQNILCLLGHSSSNQRFWSINERAALLPMTIILTTGLTAASSEAKEGIMEKYKNQFR